MFLAEHSDQLRRAVHPHASELEGAPRRAEYSGKMPHFDRDLTNIDADPVQRTAVKLEIRERLDEIDVLPHVPEEKHDSLAEWVLVATRHFREWAAKRTAEKLTLKQKRHLTQRLQALSAVYVQVEEAINEWPDGEMLQPWLSELGFAIDSLTGMVSDWPNEAHAKRSADLGRVAVVQVLHEFLTGECDLRKGLATTLIARIENGFWGGGGAAQNRYEENIQMRSDAIRKLLHRHPAA